MPGSRQLLQDHQNSQLIPAVDLPSDSVIKKRPKCKRLFTRRPYESLLNLENQNPDEILKQKGVGIYDEMEEKDAHIFSVYETRKLAISMVPWEILPFDNSDFSKKLAEFVLYVIDNARGPFSETIKQLCDGIGKGFAILEKVWQLEKNGPWKGKYSIKEFVFHRQKYWRFKDAQWNKLRGDQVFFSPSLQSYEKLERVPWSKIIHFVYNKKDTNYGNAAFKPIYWFYWFKKEGWKSWIIYLEKWGSPTVVGTHPDDAESQEIDALQDVIESIQEETKIVLPESMRIQFLETSRSGDVSYRDLSDACNAEISKAILGQTQTVEEGRRGSYALSRAHSEIRHERVEHGALAIAETIQEQLIKPLIYFNWNTDKYPQFVMTYNNRSTSSVYEVAETNNKIEDHEPSVLDTESTAETDEIPTETEEIEIDETTIEPEGPNTESSGSIEGPEETFAELNFSNLGCDISKLRSSFMNTLDQIKKSEKSKPPIINLKHIKAVLANYMGEKKAFQTAGRLKKIIESQKGQSLSDGFEIAFNKLTGQKLLS